MKQHDRIILFKIWQMRHYRAPNGWRAKGSRKVIRVQTPIPMMKSGLVFVNYSKHGPYLALTTEGRVEAERQNKLRTDRLTR